MALAVLQHHSWAKLRVLMKRLTRVSICFRHGTTLLCNCSVNMFLWCSFVCSSKSNFYFLVFISLFPMAYPNSPSPLVAVVPALENHPKEGWVKGQCVKCHGCISFRNPYAWGGCDCTQSDTRDPWKGNVASAQCHLKGHTDQRCWGEPRPLIPWSAGGVAWLVPVLAVLQSCHHTSPEALAESDPHECVSVLC